jgi:hypothetical protein
LALDDVFYLLKFNAEKVEMILASGQVDADA